MAGLESDVGAGNLNCKWDGLITVFSRFDFWDLGYSMETQKFRKAPANQEC
jgi:hypothetical protein